MKRLLALFAVLALLFPSTASAAPVPYEETRFARVAAAMAKDPLYVDTDLTDFIDGEARAAIRDAMTRTSKALGVPVFFVAIPNGYDSESYGKFGAFLAGLHTHLRRDGLFLMTDAGGDLDGAAYEVPRKLDDYDVVSYTISRPANRDQPFTDLTSRVTSALSTITTAPAGPPETHDGDTGVPAFGQEDPPVEAELLEPGLAGLLVVGPLAALLLFGLIQLVSKSRRTSRRPRTKRPRQPDAPSRPSFRWLRRHASKELTALSEELDPDRPSMMRAYDAARILYDDVESRPVKNDDSAFLDLVGVIVLVRRARIAKPGSTCFINPLHGQAGRSRRKIRDQGRNPVCEACTNGPYEDRILRLPDRRPHYTVPGRWQRGAFGSRRPGLAADVLESLGVDS